jgi:hypothetical protein
MRHGRRQLYASHHHRSLVDSVLKSILHFFDTSKVLLSSKVARQREDNCQNYEPTDDWFPRQTNKDCSIFTRIGDRFSRQNGKAKRELHIRLKKKTIVSIGSVLVSRSLSVSFYNLTENIIWYSNYS